MRFAHTSFHRCPLKKPCMANKLIAYSKQVRSTSDTQSIETNFGEENGITPFSAFK